MGRHGEHCRRVQLQILRRKTATLSFDRFVFLYLYSQREKALKVHTKLVSCVISVDSKHVWSGSADMTYLYQLCILVLLYL